ncbi:MAG: primase C-terminal domain-containing protein [Proteobacteria bacterium]|nr:primase C-terminal domain-containing protein [Pseudomonadota bacterium]
MRGTFLPQRALLKNPWGMAGNLIGYRYLRGPHPARPVLWESYTAARTGLMWHTEPGSVEAFDLRDIVAALADEYGAAAVSSGTRRAIRKRRPPPSTFGRNCSLFDTVRFWAYDRFERDERAVLEEAQRVNAQFLEPLPSSEVAATARSIARFMNTRFCPSTSSSSRRGRDRDAGVSLDRRGRQAVAGRVSAANRASATDASLRNAWSRLRAAGRRVTQATLAAEAGRSIRTVKRRWHGIVVVPDAALSGSAAAAAHDEAQDGTLKPSTHCARAFSARRLSVELSALASRPSSVSNSAYTIAISRAPDLTGARDELRRCRAAAFGPAMRYPTSGPSLPTELLDGPPDG